MSSNSAPAIPCSYLPIDSRQFSSLRCLSAHTYLSSLSTPTAPRPRPSLIHTTRKHSVLPLVRPTRRSCSNPSLDRYIESRFIGTNPPISNQRNRLIRRQWQPRNSTTPTSRNIAPRRISTSSSTTRSTMRRASWTSIRTWPFFNLIPLRLPTAPKYMLGLSTIVEEDTRHFQAILLAFSMFLSTDHLLILQRSLQRW